MFLNAATILCLHGKIGNANTENSIRKDGVFCDRIGTTIMLSLRGAKRRGNLLAAIYGTFQPNDTSQRLPRACGPRNDKVRGRIATSATPPRNDRGNRSLKIRTDSQLTVMHHKLTLIHGKQLRICFVADVNDHGILLQQYFFDCFGIAGV